MIRHTQLLTTAAAIAAAVVAVVLLVDDDGSIVGTVTFAAVAITWLMVAAMTPGGDAGRLSRATVTRIAAIATIVIAAALVATVLVAG